MATSRLTGVVGNPVALASVHPEAAGPASQEGTQQIGPWGVVGTGPGGLRYVVPGDGAAGGLLEHLPGHQGLMSGFLGPDPLLGRVRLAAPLSRSPVPHLVSGELGVAQDLPHAGATPSARPSSRIGGLRLREALEIGVQLGLEVAEAHPAGHVVLEDHPDDGRANRVRLEDLLLSSLSRLVWIRVRDLSKAVPVRRLAPGVASLPGGRLDPLPRLHLQFVPGSPGQVQRSRGAARSSRRTPPRAHRPPRASREPHGAPPRRGTSPRGSSPRG